MTTGGDRPVVGEGAVDLSFNLDPGSLTAQVESIANAIEQQIGGVFERIISLEKAGEVVPPELTAQITKLATEMQKKLSVLPKEVRQWGVELGRVNLMMKLLKKQIEDIDPSNLNAVLEAQGQLADLEDQRAEILSQVADAQQQAAEANGEYTASLTDEIKEAATAAKFTHEYRKTLDEVRNSAGETTRVNELLMQTVRRSGITTNSLVGIFERMGETVGESNAGMQLLGESMGFARISALELSQVIAASSKSFVAMLGTLGAVGLAVGVATQLFNKWVESQAKAREEQRRLNEEIIRLGPDLAGYAEGIRLIDVRSEDFTETIDSVRDLTSNLSLSLNDVADALVGDADAIETVGRTLDAVAEGAKRYGFITETLIPGLKELSTSAAFIGTSTERDFQRQIALFEKEAERLKVVADLYERTGGSLEKLRDRFQSLNSQVEENISNYLTYQTLLGDVEVSLEREKGLLVLVASGFINMAEALDLATKRSSNLDGFLDQLAKKGTIIRESLDAFIKDKDVKTVEELAQAIKSIEPDSPLLLQIPGLKQWRQQIISATGEIKSLAEAQRELEDSGSSIASQFISLARAAQSMNEAATPENVQRYADALDRFLRSVQESPGALQAYAQRLVTLRDTGALTQAQFEKLYQVIVLAAQASGQAIPAVQGLAGSAASLGQSAAGAIPGVAGLAQATYLLIQTAAGLTRVTNPADRALLGVASGGRQVGTVMSGLNEILARFNNIMGGVGVGGGGGGGSAPRSLADKVRDLASAFSALFSLRSAQRGLEDAKQQIADLQERLREIPDDLDEINRQIEEATRTGAEGVITANEQLAIENAEQRLKDLQLAFEQGFVSLSAVKAAEEDLAKTREDATKKSPELESLEERRKRLLEEQEDTAKRLQRAQEDLEAQWLRLVSAMSGAQDALAVINAATPEVTEQLKRLAEAAGLTPDEVSKLMSSINTLITNVKSNLERSGATMTVTVEAKPGTGVTYDRNRNVFTVPVEPTPTSGAGGGTRVKFFQTGGFTTAGLTLLGERGPELARLPVGTRVYNAGETQQRLGGVEANVTVEVNVGFPVDPIEARRIAATVREALVDLEYETR